MPQELAVIGVPTSAGAHHAGQERAPAALRQQGLVEMLRDGGLDVVDAGDLDTEVFRTDHTGGPARNFEAVLRVAQDVARAVELQARAGRLPVVIGGDCTISLGIVAALQRVHDDVGVGYFDGDADLSSPERTRSGILDATGVAHLLGIADTPLASIGRQRPMLVPEQLVLLGYDPTDHDSYDAAALDARPNLLRFSDADLRVDGLQCAARACEQLDARDAVLVHFDVDAVDSADLPLANFPHYGTGVSLETATAVLTVLLGTPKLAAVSLTEVNPTHDPHGGQLARYVRSVSTAIVERHHHALRVGG